MFPKGENDKDNNYPQIQELAHQRADYQARLNLLLYDGTRNKRPHAKYLYIRKRVGVVLTSTYVGDYSDELYQLLLRNAREGRVEKEYTAVDKELALLGYRTQICPSGYCLN